MKTIPLTHNQVALVDDRDYEWLSHYKWRANISRGGKDFYACAWIGPVGARIYVRMHRLILGVSQGMLVDHANHDTLDNRRANLRCATHSQNGANRLRAGNNTSGYKGVCQRSATQTWNASLQVNGQRVDLGNFPTAELAARAYDEAAFSTLGEFAFLNFPDRIDGSCIEPNKRGWHMRAKTHCARGHPFTHTGTTTKGTVRRYCRTCQRDSYRRGLRVKEQLL